MSDFKLSFNVKSAKLGDCLAAIHPFRVEDLSIQPVAVTKATTVVKRAEIPAWKHAANVIKAFGKPVSPKDVATVLEKDHGVKKAGISTHIATAIKKGLVQKTQKGYVAK